MPLGIFGSSGKDSGPKPKPLTSDDISTTKDKIPGVLNHNSYEIKDSKGSTFKLLKKTYTIERKLAEGGFAIVYLVNDKHNKNYALKRQLIRDDARQIEACKTESQIVKNLNGHKNIIGYLGHSLTVNKSGVFDYMLLTVFYSENVLQLMNSRLLSNKWFTHNEILNIFCDVCEAVARLHHSKTPVIHRDLKIENVLIDKRSSIQRPIYVLCDFGSATTKIMSKEHYTHAFMEEEIQRYTTLSYRAPEMIDLFSGVLIDTKSDIWALGILLYKLSYFSLPFAESALAIQNGLFTFPENPQIPDSIKAIINLMLTLSARHRPNIFQTAYLAFSASNQKCPIHNIEKSARIELNEAIQILHLRDKLGTNYSRLFEKAINDFEAQKRRHTIPSDNQPIQNTITTNDMPSNTTKIPYRPAEGVIVTTTKEYPEVHPRSATTSVNPRLRPKPQIHKQQPYAGIDASKDYLIENNQQCQKDEIDSSLMVNKFNKSDVEGLQYLDDHDDSALPHFSAFQPYSLAKEKRTHEIVESSSNPFVQLSSSIIDIKMDDNLFGEHFDALRKDRQFSDEDCIQNLSDKPIDMKTSEYESYSFQLPARVHRDWKAIENEMGDNPFKNAPSLLPNQYYRL